MDGVFVLKWARFYVKELAATESPATGISAHKAKKRQKSAKVLIFMLLLRAMK